CLAIREPGVGRVELSRPAIWFPPRTAGLEDSTRPTASTRFTDELRAEPLFAGALQGSMGECRAHSGRKPPLVRIHLRSNDDAKTQRNHPSPVAPDRRGGARYAPS